MLPSNRRSVTLTSGVCPMGADQCHSRGYCAIPFRRPRGSSLSLASPASGSSDLKQPVIQSPFARLQKPSAILNAQVILPGFLQQDVYFFLPEKGGVFLERGVRQPYADNES